MDALRDASNRAPAPRRAGKPRAKKAGPAPAESSRGDRAREAWTQGEVLALAADPGPNAVLEEFRARLGALEAALLAQTGADEHPGPLDPAVVERIAAKPAKLGAVLATLAQTCCKTLAASSAEGAQDHALVALRAVRLVMCIRANLTFKHPLAPESLGQKLVGACVEAKCLETALEAGDLVLGALEGSGFANLQASKGGAPRCCRPLRLADEGASDAKVCGIAVFTIYNCTRALVEAGRPEEAIAASRANLAHWLRGLAAQDAAKTVAYLKAYFSLFYHHGAAALEAAEDPHAAFRYRIEALRVVCASTDDLVSLAGKLEVAPLERLLGACNRFAKEASDTEGSPALPEDGLEATLLDALDDLEDACALALAKSDPLAQTYVHYYRTVCFQCGDIARATAMYARWLKAIGPSASNLRAAVLLSALMAIVEWTLTTRQKVPAASVEALLQALGADPAPSALPALCSSLRACTASSSDTNLDDDAVHGAAFSRRLEKDLVAHTQTCSKTKHAQLKTVLETLLAVAQAVSAEHLAKARLAGLKLLLDRHSTQGESAAAHEQLAEMREIAGQDDAYARTVANAAYNAGARLFNEAKYAEAVAFLQTSTEFASPAAAAQVSLSERFKILAVCLQRADDLAGSREAFANVIATRVGEGEIPDVLGYCKCTQAIVDADDTRPECAAAALAEMTDGAEALYAEPWSRTLLRLQLDAYVTMGRPDLADALAEDATERCFGENERAIVAIEHARCLVVRSVGLEKANADSSAFGDETDRAGEGNDGDNRRLRLLRAMEICGGALEAVADESEVASARFWLGTCQQSLEGQDEDIIAAVEFWAARDPEDLDFCALQDVGFAGEWCEVIGLHEASFRARAVFIRAARGADPERLVHIAAHKESKLGVALLARLLYEQSERLGETLAAVVAAKFYKLGYMTRLDAHPGAAPKGNDVLDDDDDADAVDVKEVRERARPRKASKASVDSGLGEFVGTLEARVNEVMANLDPETYADEHATCTFLLASLAFASTTDSREVLDTALRALKLRAACQEAPEGPLAVTGVNWKHVNDVVDCLELLCEVYISRGDPRTGRYYVERGRALAERVGSDTLLNRFQMLKGRVALLCGRPDEAEALLGALKREQSRKVALQLSLGRASIALARRDVDAAAELVDDAEHAWRAFVDQVEVSQRVADQDELAIASVAGLDLGARPVNKQRAQPRSRRSRVSVFADEARIQLLGLQGRLAVLQGQDPVRWLTQAAALGEGNPVLERQVCRAKCALGQAYLAAQQWTEARGILEGALESATRVDASPETGRTLFRALAAARVREQRTSAAVSVDWETAAMAHASFGMALSLERTRLWPDDRCHGLHRPWRSACELADELERVCAQELPADMVVCSVAALDDLGLLCVSRLARGRKPLTLVLSMSRREEDLAHAMQSLVEAAELTTKGTTTDSTADWDRARKRQWWADRKRLDQDLESFLGDIEETWLGPAAVALLAPPAVALGLEDDDLVSRTGNLVDLVGSGLGAAERLSCVEILSTLVLAAAAGSLPSDEVLERAVEALVAPYIELGGGAPAGKITSAIRKLATSLDGISRESSISIEKEQTAAFPSLAKAPSAMKVVELRAALGERGLRTSGLKKDLVARLEAFEESAGGDAPGGKATSDSEEDEVNPAATTGGSLILVLDEVLQGIPFEAMPALQERCVSRMPSLAFVAERLERAREPLDVHGAAYMVDPRGDLPETAKTLGPFLKSAGAKFGWQGSVGKLENAEKGKSLLQRALAESPTFLYCGHGSGEEFLAREQLAQLDACAASLLMGCSSGKLRAQGIFEPAGVVLAYVLAGSLAVVANLWDVTDKDIDRFTLAMLESWLDKGQRLPEAVQDARSACKLRFLVGAAPICIGVPVKPAIDERK